MAVSIAPETLPSIKEIDLYQLLLDEEKWYGCTRNEQLAVLQELENRQAARDGRQPIPVRLITEKKYILRCYGLCYSGEDGSACLMLNPHFLDRRYAAFYPPAKLLETLAHEGRHQLQTVAVERTAVGEKALSPAVYQRWCLERLLYQQGNSLYSAQFIEVDARFTALAELKRVRELLAAEGRDTASLDAAISKTLNGEKRRIVQLRRSMKLTELIALEEQLKRRYSEALHEPFDPSMPVYLFAHLALRNPKVDEKQVVDCMLAYHSLIAGGLSFAALKEQFPFMDLNVLEEDYQRLTAKHTLESPEKRIPLA